LKPSCVAFVCFSAGSVVADYIVVFKPDKFLEDRNATFDFIQNRPENASIEINGTTYSVNNTAKRQQLEEQSEIVIALCNLIKVTALQFNAIYLVSITSL
jgi:hypothetical protein